MRATLFVCLILSLIAVFQLTAENSRLNDRLHEANVKAACAQAAMMGAAGERSGFVSSMVARETQAFRSKRGRERLAELVAWGDSLVEEYVKAQLANQTKGATK